MFRKLAQKLSTEKKKRITKGAMINPMDVDFDSKTSVFLNKLTKHAVNLYEKKCDVKNFSKLVLSDIHNNSGNDIMNELFAKGVIDPFEDEKLADLSNNSRFLRDLGLLE